uniref:aralkylamine N-acetyltransferase n=1 Tax=Plectus sambesii TaxID=2011161 RepID=A0A914WMY7_9BILA
MELIGDVEPFPVESRIRGVRFEIATPLMNEELHRFMLEHFRVEEPITRSVGSTKEDVFDFFIDLRDAGLRGPYSIAVFNEETHELIGCCLNEVCDIPDHPECGPSGDIYKRENANKILNFIETVEEELHDLVDSKRMLKIGVICIHPKYGRRGIGRRLIEESLDMARDENCDHAAAVATARASQGLFEKMGFQTLREVPYATYSPKGEVIFKVLHDGVQSGKLMVKEL